MTTAALPQRSTRWIYGPVLDIALGCGGLYALLFVLFPLFSDSMTSGVPLAFVTFLILTISIPHYGATLMRVYRERSERRKYAIFGVWITLALCVWFVIGVYDVLVASWMLTLYLTWSPWHYSGQNYGISLMFLARRGVVVTPLAKRALWTTFVCSFALAFLGMHQTVRAVAPEIVTFQSLALPASLVAPVATLVLAGYLGALAVVAQQLLRTGSLRDVAPSALLLLTQSMWFSLPFALSYWATSLGPLDVSVHILAGTLWVAVAHAAQYLWITTYYAKKEASWGGIAPYYGSILLAGATAWIVPAVLFAPYALGTHPFSTGLLLLMASVINLHHFVLDGAIWKLRGGRVASILIRDTKEPEAGEPEIAFRRHRGWKRAAIAFGVLCLCARFVYFSNAAVVYPAAMSQGRYDIAAMALSNVAFIGGDRAEHRTELGDQFKRQLDFETARAQYLRAIELDPRFARAHVQLASLYAMEGDNAQAISHYRRALEINPSAERTRAKLEEILRKQEMLDRPLAHEASD